MMNMFGKIPSFAVINFVEYLQKQWKAGRKFTAEMLSKAEFDKFMKFMQTPEKK